MPGVDFFFENIEISHKMEDMKKIEIPSQQGYDTLKKA